MGLLALTGGKVFSGVPESGATPGCLLVRDDRIDGVYESVRDAERTAGTAVERIDVTGTTVLPGLMDCHVHLCFSGEPDSFQRLDFDFDGAAERAAAHLRAGVTTVRDLGGPVLAIFELRDQIATGRVAGPRVLAAGNIVTTPDGHGCWHGALVETEAEMVQAMEQAARRGADCVKMAVSGGVATATSDLFAVQFSESVVRAGVAAAHRLGLRVAAHASNPEGVRISAAAGVDSIEHAVMIDDDSLAALVHGRSVVVPTLTGTDKPADFLTDPGVPVHIREKAKVTLPVHRPSIARLAAAGVPMAAGTDAGALVPHGLLANEAAQLVGCGLSNEQAVLAATSNAASLLGLADLLGTLEPGKLADVLVVAGNPLEDIACLRDVRLVLKNGSVVHRA